MNTNLLRIVCLAGALTFAALSNASAQTASQLYTEGAQSYEAGNTAVAKQKLRLSLEVDKNFRPATVLLVKIAAEEREAGSQPSGVSVRSLEKVIVPVEFNETSLKTAIEVLRQRISEKSGGKVEVNFVLKLPPDLENKRVTLHLDHAPASEVMRYLGSLAGVEFKIEQYAVMVLPVGSTATTAASSSPAGAVPTR